MIKHDSLIDLSAEAAVKAVREHAGSMQLAAHAAAGVPLSRYEVAKLSPPKLSLSKLSLVGLLLTGAVTPAMAEGRSPDETVIETSTQDAIHLAPPAAAQQDPQPATGGPADTYSAYRGRVTTEMADWRRRMQSFDTRVAAGSTRPAQVAQARLRSAWDAIEVEARNVQTASARDWDRTKKAYQTASLRMTAAWDKIRL